jgi:hypothetical protein
MYSQESYTPVMAAAIALSGRHGALPPALPHTTISQHAAQQSLSC